MQTPNQNRGAALLVFIIFFLVASVVLTFGIGRSAYHDLITYRTLDAGKRSVYAAEAAIEDAVYRHRDGRNYSDAESFTTLGNTVLVTRTLVGDEYEIVAEGETDGSYRTTTINLTVGDGVAFNFGLQSGNGGITMSNNSTIYGNVFTNRTVEGQGSALVRGDVIAGGPLGLVDSVTATGSVWAHTIRDSVIGGDAHYYDATTKIATIVNGNSYPGSADQAEIPMPIPDSKIEEWKTNIANTGTIIPATDARCSSGTYVIQSNITLDNVKIECNVELRKQGASTVITFAGPVWISGNLSFSQGPSIVAAPSLGSKSVQVIVDNEANRLTSSKITVNQSTQFTSGNAKSYVMLVSMNNSAETGGVEKAINLAQSANGKVLVYAPHGLIDMGNSISLKEVTGYQISIGNGAEVIYESGLMNLLFTSGPGGGYVTSEWQEIE